MYKPTEIPVFGPNDLDLGGFTGTVLVPMNGFRLAADPDLGETCLALEQGELFRRVPVMRRAHLLRDADALARHPFDRSVLTFANRYGWLVGDVRPLMRKATVADLFGQEPGPHDFVVTSTTAQPLSLWREHLRRFGAVRLLQEAIANPQAMGAVIARTVHWHERSLDLMLPAPDGADLPLGTLSLDVPEDVETLESLPRADRLRVARYAIRRAVNEALVGPQGVGLYVTERSTKHGDLALRHAPKTLLGAIYLHLAMELAGGSADRRMGMCERCGEPMPLRGRVKRYCGRNCNEAARYQRRLAGTTAVNTTTGKD